MNPRPSTGPKLADEESALDLYLDALLGDVEQDELEDDEHEMLPVVRASIAEIVHGSLLDDEESLSDLVHAAPIDVIDEFDDFEASAVLADIEQFDEIDEPADADEFIDYRETLKATSSAPALVPSVSRAVPRVPQSQALTPKAAAPETSEPKVAERQVPEAKFTELKPVEAIRAERAFTEPDCPISGPMTCLILNRSCGAVAVRVTDIDVVVEWAGQVVRSATAAEGHCGILPYAGKQAAIVDLAANVFKLGAPTTQRLSAGYTGTRLVVVGGGRMAFICDEIGQMLTVRPDDVVWANKATQTPWNDGVLKRGTCMLVNIDALADLYCRPDQHS
jgi:hypothetical protein